MIDPRITCCYLYTISKYGYPPAAEDTLKYLDEYKSLGFQSVELEGIRKDHLEKVYKIRNQIAVRIKELKLEVPYFCIVLPGLSSADANERKENLELFRKGCEIAHLLGSKGVLDNAPLPPYQFPDDIPVVRHYHEDVILSAKFPKDLNWKNYWDQMVETYREACDIASEYNLTYQMHPALGVLSATTDAFLYFHDAVGRDNLRFNFDTANQYFLKDNLQLSLRRLADYIDYIHISDNGGNRVEHLAIGDGVIRWEDFFETLDLINFKGHFGIDIGGSESVVEDLDAAYKNAAKFLENKI
ncbi:sugar phosphate isomerase/epimerase family protein [Balneola sp. EhC07]|uniref:sugar phosphate isomerase/epimerase family protein n=1 Tax=Balneola sp. EhC07 TaxID=1849360 RepID=UPI0009ECC946|nr:sugar phosphate isomerase/epimerase family protein [Balneola sp. EhC07]